MILKETTGVKKGIADQIDSLERKAYNAGVDAGMKATRECLEAEYERGMKELHNAMADILEWNEASEEPVPFEDMAVYLINECPRNVIAMAEECRKHKGERGYAPKAGDKVRDPSGRECVVTNTKTHIHVLYDDGKTHKWDKTDKFIFVGDLDNISFFLEEE